MPVCSTRPTARSSSVVNRTPRWVCGAPLGEVGRAVQGHHRLARAGRSADPGRAVPARGDQGELFGREEGHPAVDGRGHRRDRQGDGQLLYPHGRRRWEHPTSEGTGAVVGDELLLQHRHQRIDLRLLETCRQRRQPGHEVGLTDEVDLLCAGVHVLAREDPHGPQRLPGHPVVTERVVDPVRDAPEQGALVVAALVPAEDAVAQHPDVVPVADVDHDDAARADEQRVDGSASRARPAAVEQHPPAQQLECLELLRDVGSRSGRQRIAAGRLPGRNVVLDSPVETRIRVYGHRHSPPMVSVTRPG